MNLKGKEKKIRRKENSREIKTEVKEFFLRNINRSKLNHLKKGNEGKRVDKERRKAWII